MTLAAVLRTWRWVYLLRPMAPTIKPWRVFGVGLVGFSAVFFAPLRLGEVVRPYMMSQEGDVTFVQAVGTLAAERIIDGLTLVLLAALAFTLSTPLSPLPSHVGSLPIPVSLVPHTIFLATLMFSGAFCAMALLYFTREPARRLVRAILGVFSARLADLGAGLVERLAESFGFLPSWQRSAPFLRNTVLYWLCSGCAHFVLLRGVGLAATLPQAFVTMGVIALGSLLPAGPGFFGAYQIACYTSLAMYNSEHDVLTKGAVAVFASYLTHVAVNAVSGGAGLVILSRASTSARTAP
jgi:glycosyltransferase 2 family protein